MAMMELLLKEDVDNLGLRGELVKVRPGYGRNYLLPKRLAIQATPGNVKQIEMQRRALLKKEATEKSSALAQAELLGNERLEFVRRAGEHGVLFGSVTSMDIAQALKARASRSIVGGFSSRTRSKSWVSPKCRSSCTVRWWPRSRSL